MELSTDYEFVMADIMTEWKESLPAVIAGNDPYHPATPKKVRIDLYHIFGLVSRSTNVSPDFLRSTKRYRSLTRARRIYYLLANRLTEEGLQEKADLFGHTYNAARVGTNEAERMYATNGRFREDCDALLDGFYDH